MSSQSATRAEQRRCCLSHRCGVSGRRQVPLRPSPGAGGLLSGRWAGLGEGGPFCPGLERQSCLVTMLLGREDVPFRSAGLLVRVTHSPSPLFRGDQPAWFVFCFAP